MTRIQAFLFAAMLPLLSFATRIEGYAPLLVGQPVELIKLQDYITRTPEVLESTVVGKDSMFNIYYDVKEIGHYLLRVGNSHSEIFLQPDAHYRVEYNPSYTASGLGWEGNRGEVWFFGLDSTDINYEINYIDREIDEFIEYNMGFQLDSSFLNRLEMFKKNIRAKYQDREVPASTFLMNHIIYRIAYLDHIRFPARIEDFKVQMYLAYLKGKKLKHQHPTYMRFFLAFFDGYLQQLPNRILAHVDTAIWLGSPQYMLATLGSDPFLENMERRELVMINSLGQVYHKRTYPQYPIQVMLDSVANYSPYPQNRITAKNLLDKLRVLTPGYPAPRFEIPMGDTTMFTPNSFDDKFLYIQFFKLSNREAVRELRAMQELQERFQKYFRMVAINIEPEISDPELWKELQQSNVLVLHAPNGEEVAKQYNVRTTPHYAVIDAHGFIVQTPASRPVDKGGDRSVRGLLIQIENALKYQEYQNEQR